MTLLNNINIIHLIYISITCLSNLLLTAIHLDSIIHYQDSLTVSIVSGYFFA